MTISINELEEMMKKEIKLPETLLDELRADKRKGVQLLLKKWQKKLEEKQNKIMRFQELKTFDQSYSGENILIAGIDEVGRGPLAGPVVAAAVILDKDFYFPDIFDSKQLTKEKREECYRYIMEHAIAVGIGSIEPEEIDQINIYEATKKAMIVAIEHLPIKPNYLLIDAMVLPIPIRQQKVIKGDQKSLSIAASSIIAKVTRDRMMCALAERYPDYGFDHNAGYGTSQHLNAIEKYGVLKEHRKSFSPVKEKVGQL